MKKYSIILFIAFVLGACDDFLDRPPLTQANDETLWTSENNVRLYANSFYTTFFPGYNSGFGTEYAPLRGYTFNDDVASTGIQTSFEPQAPATRSSLLETAPWLLTYAGPTWNFTWVRKSNLLLERVEQMKDTYLEEEPYKHWSAVARFFRGYEYCRLVSVFGNVPYYDHVLLDSETDLLYKDRDDRAVVMDNVYDDFEYVLANMRDLDGNAQYVNRFVAAGFISRFMLFEGTWQKYHLGNTEKATKYLDLAVRAANVVMTSGKWSFTSDFRSLFGSEDLTSNKEVIMFRRYDAGLVMHSIASYSNTTESQPSAANLDLIKAFIAVDGKPYQQSTVPDADKLDLGHLKVTRDPRFEATFWDTPRAQASTLLYTDKFIDRRGPTSAVNGTYPAQYGSSSNTSDAPVMRLAEVVLNWIEAKAELATMGGPAVTQADLEASINAIRKRPLDAKAAADGVKQTASLDITAVPNDPDRDLTVDPLLWEIRRERRMEFAFEHTRLLDLKRWKKIEYMNGNANTDILRGPWIDFPTEFPDYLIKAKEKVLKVQKTDGTIVTYDGTNKADMVGFYVPESIANRAAFTDKVYMAPIGNNEISQYAERGYTLSQTTGWGN